MAIVFLNPRKLGRNLSKLQDATLESKIPEEIPVSLFDNIYQCAFLPPKEVYEKFSFADMVNMIENASAACVAMESFTNYALYFEKLEKYVSVGKKRRLF